MLEEFKKYVSNYDLNNPLIKLKYKHSIRVMKLARKYAKLLNFNKEEIKIATLIGLLHDYGRFEQLKVYNSFNDRKTIDHALYGVRVLFEKGEITKYSKDVNDYDLISFAIANHNKYKIEDNSSVRYMKHAQLIRDVDKIDILYLIGYLGETTLLSDDEDISPNIIEKIEKYESIPYDEIKNMNDKIVIYFAYPFDIYNDICLKKVKKNINYLYKRLNNKKFDRVKQIIDKYIDERIDKNVRKKI